MDPGCSWCLLLLPLQCRNSHSYPWIISQLILSEGRNFLPSRPGRSCCFAAELTGLSKESEKKKKKKVVGMVRDGSVGMSSSGTEQLSHVWDELRAWGH